MNNKELYGSSEKLEELDKVGKRLSTFTKDLAALPEKNDLHQLFTDQLLIKQLNDLSNEHIKNYNDLKQSHFNERMLVNLNSVNEIIDAELIAPLEVKEHRGVRWVMLKMTIKNEGKAEGKI